MEYIPEHLFKFASEKRDQVLWQAASANDYIVEVLDLPPDELAADIDRYLVNAVSRSSLDDRSVTIAIVRGMFEGAEFGTGEVPASQRQRKLATALLKADIGRIAIDETIELVRELVLDIEDPDLTRLLVQSEERDPVLPSEPPSRS